MAVNVLIKTDHGNKRVCLGAFDNLATLRREIESSLNMDLVS